MSGFDQIENNFKLLREIDYDNREGGRYAYVQMMAYTRELNNLLMAFHSSAKNEIKEIGDIHEQLNDLVALTFKARHRHIFELHSKKLEEICKRLQIKLSAGNKDHLVTQPKLVA